MACSSRKSYSKNGSVTPSDHQNPGNSTTGMFALWVSAFTFPHMNPGPGWFTVQVREVKGLVGSYIAYNKRSKSVSRNSGVLWRKR